MEDRASPPPFDHEPHSEPVPLSHDQLTAAAELAATALDFIDSSLAGAVAEGALTAEEAAAQRATAVESLRQKLQTAEAGQWAPPTDAGALRRTSFADLALGGLDMFDATGHAAIAAGELTEEEFLLRRRQLVDRNTQIVDGLSSRGDE